MIHRRRSTCRLCNSADVQLVFALEPAPLAEAYLPSERAAEGDARYPLDVFLCKSCGGVQLLDVIDAGYLFRNYQYTSSMSPDLGDHFKRYAADVCERFKPNPGSLVVDVGSNNGLLLRQFKDRGLNVYGIDPAEEIALAASLAGIPTVPAFMNAGAGRKLRQLISPASIVTANNVLAHAEEPGVILDGVREVLADDGVFVFEVSYLPDTISGMVFDYFYHEHGVFYTALSLMGFLYRHGLALWDAERVPTKGGSLRCYARKSGESTPFCAPTKCLARLMGDEVTAGHHTPEPYRDFIARVNARRDETVRCLREYQGKNLRVVGYGASSTTTVLLHHFKIGGFLDYLVDDNEARHGLVSPGYHLPVKSPNELYGPNKPDAVLITAWRFADNIIKRHGQYLEEGGVFIRPLPFFQEVTA